MIEIEYADLLSGDSIPIQNVGHFRSPKLSEMMPTKGIGWFRYNLYLYYIKSDKAMMTKMLSSLGAGAIAEILNGDIDMYEFISSCQPIYEMFAVAIDFFMEESVEFDPNLNAFLVKQDDDVIGAINDENFDDVRSIILMMNYIQQEKTNVSTKHSSKSSEDAWNLAQKYLAEQEKIAKDSDDVYSISNMISKLCVISNSYNLLNIYELTVFQLYDQFFQASYLRGINFSESIVSNHGSKDFKYDDWMKPVNNY